MRIRTSFALFLMLLSSTGCHESVSTVDTTKLIVPNEEQQQQIKAFDEKINQEEFGSPMPNGSPARKSAK